MFKNEILVSSTGVIGEQLNPELIIEKINKLQFTDSKMLIDAVKCNKYHRYIH